MNEAAWLLSGPTGGAMVPGNGIDPESLVRLANARMPSGRYTGELLLDLPEEYVLWFANRGSEELAAHLASIYMIRFNGQEEMLRALVESGDREDRNQVGEPRHSDDESLPDELEWIFAMLESE
jgi:uncharacterized protein